MTRHAAPGADAAPGPDGDGGFVDDRLVVDPSRTVGALTALRASRCRTCHRTEFPALGGCPADDGPVDEVALGPDAVLVGFTEVLHPPPGAQVEVPYTLAVARFADHDLDVLGLLEDHAPVDQLAVGARLHVVAVPFGGGRTYGYRLAPGA